MRRPLGPLATVWTVLVGLMAIGSVLLTAQQFGWLTVWQGLQVTLGVLLLGIAVTAVGVAATALLTRPATTRPTPQARPADPAHQAAGQHAGQNAGQQRDALVHLCIGLRDNVDNPALRERITRALAAVDVVAVDAEGGMFDPAQHRAVDSVPAADPALHNRVASTERPGYLDHGLLLRPADVTVYQVGPGHA